MNSAHTWTRASELVLLSLNISSLAQLPQIQSLGPAIGASIGDTCTLQPLEIEIGDRDRKNQILGKVESCEEEGKNNQREQKWGRERKQGWEERW